MKSLILALSILLIFPTLVVGGENAEAYLTEKMIPLAQEFLQRIGQTNKLSLETNQVKNYRVDYFNSRPGCTANLRLTNGCVLSFVTETNKTEIWSFQRPIKTYYNFMADTPKAKVEAVKALNLRNKLNEDTALALAKKYFRVMGHKEENFHPPEIAQCYWSGGEDNHGGKLPYYAVTWHRKDVDVVHLTENGHVGDRYVVIEVSGIDASLISYSKGMLPIGRDF